MKITVEFEFKDGTTGEDVQYDGPFPYREFPTWESMVFKLWSLGDLYMDNQDLLPITRIIVEDDLDPTHVNTLYDVRLDDEPERFELRRNQ